MITTRRHEDRGHSKYGGWLDSRHSFSFAHYYDPDHMGFGPLRVINEDKVLGGAGFDGHGHRDMEIISYVIDGALEHKDSMGNGSVIRAGDVQRMSAGTGVMHSEYNASQTDPVHFLQIWIEPSATRLAPGYAQKSFAHIGPDDGFVLVVSGDGRGGSLSMNRDADVYLASLEDGTLLSHSLRPHRQAWLHVISGGVRVNGQDLSSGDAVAIRQEEDIAVTGTGDAKILLFDLEA